MRYGRQLEDGFELLLAPEESDYLPGENLSGTRQTYHQIARTIPAAFILDELPEVPKAKSFARRRR